MKLSLNRKRNVSSDPNMTPLIDVIFMLLLFFILTSAFVKPSISVKLPQASDLDKLKNTDIVVSVDGKKQVYINKDSVSLEDLPSKLSSTVEGIKLKEGEKKRIIFYGDENIPYKVFVKIIDIIKNTGVGEINIAHE